MEAYIKLEKYLTLKANACGSSAQDTIRRHTIEKIYEDVFGREFPSSNPYRSDKRTIKFRGKSVNDGHWILGDICHFDVETVNIGLCEVDTMTIGQFTGFTDWLGKNIYEGDVIQRYFVDEDGEKHKTQGLVALEDGAFIVKREDGNTILMHDVKGWTVLGNIHDNPELLKGGEK